MNKRITLPVYMIMCVMCFSAFSPSIDDSIRVLLSKHHNEDSTKVNLLLQAAEIMVQKNEPSLQDYIDQADRIAKKIGYREGIASSKRIKGISLINSDKKAAITLLDESLTLSRDIDDKHGEAQTLIAMGVLHNSLGDNDKCLNLYREALSIANEIPNQSLQTKCLINIANHNHSQGNHNEALDRYYEALALSKSTGNSETRNQCLSGLGSLFAIQGNHQKALDYFRQSMEIAEKSGDRDGQITALINIAETYIDQQKNSSAVETLTKALDLAGGSKNFDLIAEILLKIGNAFSHSDPSLSLQYYEKALENANQHDGSEIMMHILTGMGEAWQDSGVPDRALEFYEKANAVAQKIGKPVPMCRILSNKAKAMSMLNDYDEAKKWAVQAKNIADQHHLIVCQRDINLLLSQIFSKTGNFKEATVFLGNYMTFNDSINNSSNTKKMAELEYQYKYEKEIKAIEFELQQKEAVLEARNKQSLIVNITLGSILLTILIFAFIMVRIYIKKRKTHQLILLQSQEITEANTALEEISSTKDRFFTIIAHDLRGAFNSILGFSNLLRTDAGGDDQNDLSMLIRESAENAYKLLNNLLAWSMANVGLMPFKPVSIRLLSFVEQNKVGWSSRASNKNISVVYNIPENFEIVADADMINTIIRNLVNNSVKYTPRGGQISIGATTTAGGAILTISDNGVGMTPEVLGNLFKINKKMSMPGTEKEMGSGLGLLICKEFAATHKGSIWAESEPGKGSRFNVFIPSADN